MSHAKAQSTLSATHWAVLSDSERRLSSFPNPMVTLCKDYLKTGNQTVAVQLVDALKPLVFKIIRSKLPCWTDHEDVAQDVFLKLFSRLHQYRENVPLEHWVSRIAVTVCIDYLRHKKRRPKLNLHEFSSQEQEVLQHLYQDARQECVRNHLATRDLVNRLLSHLAPKDQIVIRMLDLEEQSVQSISNKTGWSKAMIKTRASRARRKLRIFLKTLEKEYQ